ncbi:Redox-sensitive transcriptional regulator (AT-rich DNA-binding protein) [Fructilactobacillus florum 8D]|uniref:Redox-sensing transcriptional repressor Rex n=2 Tax=Fructilactobacillus florum TaxID=640331 RepID=W9EDX8_9LACO|nr:redox-sensing transcriptional repressor Rex [Fructilactobacillus florum]EKK20027.1 Redox-sensitive transcriptional regulator (AT-rich DNA-binding protein) [Fructilactobacillus florum 2F]ETO40297.1 Redox-sensitive transcriptional regulator (AT-rich DNA-binding protein) [Fructilactobacillus florum 8D]KRM92546.1 redox-sensing transcriptional repressor Rex [Fructilactobacillus florum DSM 22689 = JCM 16035]
MTETKIPRATAKRLPLYYRYLNILHDGGKTRVSSNELADAIRVDSATIRRDFSYFGALGKRGYGYDVDNLLAFFKDILDQDRLTNVALVGVGNLGHALLNFSFHQDSNIRISAAFDINSQEINTVQSGVPIYPIEQLVTQLQDQQITVAILTVPSRVAQEVANQVAETGVKGILNFTSIRLSVPDRIRVHNVDLTNELQTLIYFIDHYDQK